MDVDPLTGEPLEAEQPFHPFRKTFLLRGAVGKYAVSTLLLSLGFQLGDHLQLGAKNFTAEQTSSLLALALSLAYEAAIFKQSSPIFLTTEELEGSKSNGQEPGTLFDGWRPWTPEMLSEELASLTLEAKSFRTLQNLVALETSRGNGLYITFSFDPYPGCVRPTQANILSPVGIVYGCVKTEIAVVMCHLREEGLIRDVVIVPTLSQIFVTPKGYSTIERMKDPADADAGAAFLICRFTPGLDKVFETVYHTFAAEAPSLCRIKRVIDVPHIDRIDDRILREIRHASFVVVDLTDHNFNVAFEAGYALALGKPIVWTMQMADEGLKLPFDIQSHNVLLYSADRLPAFREELRLRIRVALEKVKEQVLGKATVQ